MASIKALHGLKPSTPIDAVDVYFNPNKRLWACRCRKNGLIKKYAPVVIAPLGAAVVIHESRQKDPRKNLYAFTRLDHGTTSFDVEGWTDVADSLESGIELSYNPYVGAFFYRKDTSQQVEYVASLIMLAANNGAPRCVAIP